MGMTPIFVCVKFGVIIGARNILELVLHPSAHSVVWTNTEHICTGVDLVKHASLMTLILASRTSLPLHIQ